MFLAVIQLLLPLLITVLGIRGWRVGPHQGGLLPVLLVHHWQGRLRPRLLQVGQFSFYNFKLFWRKLLLRIFHLHWSTGAVHGSAASSSSASRSATPATSPEPSGQLAALVLRMKMMKLSRHAISPEHPFIDLIVRVTFGSTIEHFKLHSCGFVHLQDVLQLNWTIIPFSLLKMVQLNNQNVVQQKLFRKTFWRRNPGVCNVRPKSKNEMKV